VSGQLRLLERPCVWCGGPIVATRRDALTCCKSHRQAAHRAKISRADQVAAAEPLRLAYADPPYPGKAKSCYGDHRDFAGEVDHFALLSHLQGYDGWALSTSAEALPAVLAAAVAQDLSVRVAVWDRGARPHATARVLNGWEAVVYAGGRQVPGADRQIEDVLRDVRPRRRSTRPGAVIGMKPPAFCAWIFGLLGARRGDELDDVFPGSGIVGWCWESYTRAPAGQATA
jgi:hypothetical protein